MERFLSLKNQLLKFLFYLEVFLVPIIFLPWGNFSNFLVKEYFLAFGVFLFLVFWVFFALVEQKIILPKNKIAFLLTLWLLIAGLSTIFSVNRKISFWNYDRSGTFIDFTLLFLVFSQASLILLNLNPETKRNFICNVLRIFIFSGWLTILLFLGQMFFKFFPWEFTKLAGWNTINSPYTFSLFVVFHLGCLILFWSDLVKHQKKIFSLFFLIVFLFDFLTLLVINYWFAWLGLFLLSLFWFWREVFFQEETNKTLKIFLPQVSLVIAALFLFFKISLPFPVNIPPEASLSHSLTWRIVWQSLNQNPKNFLLGSGPGTFLYQFRFFKPLEMNQTLFWSSDFFEGSAWLGTMTLELGFLAFLIFIFLNVHLLKKGIEECFSKKFELSTRRFAYSLLILILLIFFYWVFVPANLVLGFLLMIFLAFWTSISPGEEKNFWQILVEGKPLKVFLSSLLLIIFFFVALFGFWFLGRSFLSQYFYSKALSFIKNKQWSQANSLLEKATSFYASDEYWRSLANSYFLEAQEVLSKEDLSFEERTAIFISLFQKAIEAGRLAVNYNPKASENWLTLGLLYENLISSAQGAEDLAKTYYTQAQVVDPKNPQIPFRLAMVHFALAQNWGNILETATKTQKLTPEEKANLEKKKQEEVEKTKMFLNQALSLKNDFSEALNLWQQISQ